jgi:hypothetical protein
VAIFPVRSLRFIVLILVRPCKKCKRGLAK